MAEAPQRGVFLDWKVLAAAVAVLLGGQGTTAALLTGEQPRVVIDEDVAALLDETQDHTELLEELVREQRRTRRALERLGGAPAGAMSMEVESWERSP